MIRNLFRIASGVIVCMLIISACSEDDAVFSGFAINSEDIAVAAEGGSERVLVESSAKWVATASEPWVSVSPANGIGTTECTIVVDSTLVNELRTAIVRFTPENMEAQEITIRQTGFGKMIAIETPEDEIAASGRQEDRFYEAIVTSNVPFNVNIEYQEGEPDWLSTDNYEIELDRGARPRTAKVRFNWKMNTTPEPRVAQINFVPANEGDVLETPAQLLLTQKAAVKIEDNRLGDSIALLTIFERLNSMGDPWDPSENMRNWKNVSLWEASDEDLPSPEAVGRVRSATFMVFRTDETIPQEIHYLKYLESLNISTNTNTMLLSIDLGSDICELDYLKELTLFSYGLVSLPDDFVKLGKSLEYLDLSANNFNDIPEILTPENFPKLKNLRMIASRRWNTTDLRNADNYEEGLGLHINTASNNSLRRLLLWENLEELSLSNCYIEGQLPDFTVGEDGVMAYSQSDVDAFGGDTIQYLADNSIPKILPNMKHLALNLNFFTGELPDWLLYHPNLLMWVPDLLIFNQQEQGRNSNGEIVRFDNAPSSFEYYYSVFPGMREKYELKEEITE